MAANENHKVPERGYGMGYQESVEIESKCLFGMEADEFYRRQVGLVLDEIPDSLYKNSKALFPGKLGGGHMLPEGVTLREKAGNAGMRLVETFDLKLGAGKKILDLAVGEGDTSRYLSTTGANVEARDFEDYLVERARERDAEIKKNIDETGDLRRDVNKGDENVPGKVSYATGDYSKIKESVGHDDSFEVISCLCRSFIYLGERENYVKALKDFYDLLVPGGKVVLQSRKKIKKNTFPWSDGMGTSFTRTPEGYLCMIDERSGTKFIWRTDQEIRTLSDGVKQSISSRYLEYADGMIKELGRVVADHHLDFSDLNCIGGIMREAGFENLLLKVENLTIDGSLIMFAIVAEKPRD